MGTDDIADVSNFSDPGGCYLLDVSNYLLLGVIAQAEHRSGPSRGVDLKAGAECHHLVGGKFRRIDRGGELGLRDIGVQDGSERLKILLAPEFFHVLYEV